MYSRNRFNGHCMRQVARSTRTSSLSPSRYIWVLIKHYTTVCWPTSFYDGGDKLPAPLATCLQEKFVERKSYKRAKRQPNSQIKILEPTALQKSQISGFWLQKSHSGNPDSTRHSRSFVVNCADVALSVF